MLGLDTVPHLGGKLRRGLAKKLADGTGTVHAGNVQGNRTSDGPALSIKFAGKSEASVCQMRNIIRVSPLSRAALKGPFPVFPRLSYIYLILQCHVQSSIITPYRHASIH